MGDIGAGVSAISSGVRIYLPLNLIVLLFLLEFEESAFLSMFPTKPRHFLVYDS